MTTFDIHNRENFRSGSSIRVIVDTVNRTITWHVFKTGSSTLDLNMCAPSNNDYAAFHGYKQRGSDAAAIEMVTLDDGTTRPASNADKFAAISRIVDHYNSGADTWSVKSEGEGTMLFRAILEFKGEGCDPVALRKWFTELDGKKRRQYEAVPAIKVILDRMRAENSKNVDVAGLLDDLSKV